MYFVLIGNAKSGKSYFARVASGERFHTGYTATTKPQLTTVNYKTSGQHVSMGFWDTSQLYHTFYACLKQSDCILIFFDKTDPAASLHYFTKKDRHQQTSLIDALEENPNFKAAHKIIVISKADMGETSSIPEQANELKKMLGDAEIMMCSAKTKCGISELLDAATKEYIHRNAGKANQRLFSRKRISSSTTSHDEDASLLDKSTKKGIRYLFSCLS